MLSNAKLTYFAAKLERFNNGELLGQDCIDLFQEMIDTGACEMFGGRVEKMCHVFVIAGYCHE